MFFAILFINANIIKDGTKRIVNYSQEFIPEAPFEFHIKNKNLTVVENENFEIILNLIGNDIPEKAFVLLKNKKIKLKKVNNTTFKYEFKNVQEKKEFSFEAAGFNSKNYRLKTISKPVIMGFEIEINYPNYTQLETQKLKNISDLNVPKGTKITWGFNTKNTEKINFTEDDNTIVLTKIFANKYLAHFVKRYFAKQQQAIYNFLTEQLFYKAIIIRILPLGSNFLTNLIAGACQLNAKAFIAGSFIGFIPQMVIFSLAGAGIKLASSSHLIASISLFILALLLSYHLYAKQKNLTSN